MNILIPKTTWNWRILLNLLSESEDSELAIVGMMIDQAEVEYKDDILKIKLLRKN